MNTNTGQVYELGLEAQARMGAGPTAMFTALEDQSPRFTDDERAAFRDSLRGDVIVPVSGRVAQTMKLGQREQTRRRRRRKAERQARRQNR